MARKDRLYSSKLSILQMLELDFLKKRNRKLQRNCVSLDFRLISSHTISLTPFELWITDHAVKAHRSPQQRKC